MKYFIIIFICFIYKSSFSQTPSVVSRSSDVVVASDGGLITRNTLRPPVYNDTISANSSLHLLDSCGKLIFTYSDNSYWVRACNPKRWVIILNQENQVNLIQTNNGISRNGSIIQLGQIVNQAGAPATLSSSREIPLNTFAIRLTGPGYLQSNAIKITGETTSGDGSPGGIKLYGRTATISNNGYSYGVQELSFVTATAGFRGYLGVQSWPYVTGGLPGGLSGKFAGYVNSFSAGPLWDGSIGGTNQLPVMLGYFSGLQTQAGGILNAYDHYCSEINTVGGTTQNPAVTNHYAFYAEPFTYATNNYGVFMNGNQINYMGGPLGLGTQHGGYKLNVNGSIRQNKDSSELVSSITSESVQLIDTITGKFKRIPATNLYIFNNGLTNTSGTVQLGGSLIQATNIAVGNNSLGIVAANSTISTNRITIDNTNALMSGRYEDFSSINNIYVNQDNIQIISTQPIGARRILIDSITGIQIGENISGIYKGIIVKKTTSQLQFNAYGSETFTGAPTKLLAETSTGDIIEVGGRNLQSGTTYTVLSTDVYKIIGLSNSAARTITLPAASAFPSGVTVWFKDEAGTAGTGNITINRAGSDTIDGATSYTISSNYGFIGLYSNGSNAWFVR